MRPTFNEHASSYFFRASLICLFLSFGLLRPQRIINQQPRIMCHLSRIINHSITN